MLHLRGRAPQTAPAPRGPRARMLEPIVIVVVINMIVIVIVIVIVVIVIVVVIIIVVVVVVVVVIVIVIVFLRLEVAADERQGVEARQGRQAVREGLHNNNLVFF